MQLSNKGALFFFSSTLSKKFLSKLPSPLAWGIKHLSGF